MIVLNKKKKKKKRSKLFWYLKTSTRDLIRSHKTTKDHLIK